MSLHWRLGALGAFISKYVEQVYLRFADGILPFIIVVRQPYDIRVEANEGFLGNVAFLRCFIPEHVRKFVVVSSWFRGDEELHAEMVDMGKLKFN